MFRYNAVIMSHIWQLEPREYLLQIALHRHTPVYLVATRERQTVSQTETWSECPEITAKTCFRLQSLTDEIYNYFNFLVDFSRLARESFHWNKLFDQSFYLISDSVIAFPLNWNYKKYVNHEFIANNAQFFAKISYIFIWM